MAFVDASKRDLEKDPAKPGDIVKRVAAGRTTWQRVSYPGEVLTRGGDRPVPSSPERVSR